MTYQPKSGPELIGYLLGKGLLAYLMAFLITTYNLPLAIAALLIFLV